ncbi:heavy metal translocating P-type ATPase [Chitinophagaceae bacterium IBVUCB1]|nr:heavy metal translocating P-type ATPase [Chitinophagaceae bacterium IBVUCB1]
MPTIDKERNTIIISKPIVHTSAACYHCGTDCITNSIAIDEKVFCCEGCKLVYEILNDNGLCDYYKLQSHPGLSQIKPARSDKFAYLDNEEIASKLYKFTDGNHTMVTLYIPGVHCASCMWLLEHMNKLAAGITESRLNFTSKEVTIRYKRDAISLRRIVELLTTIGYEPYISLDDATQEKTKNYNKQLIYKLGVAGFCFGNIMLMSFPEYLSLDKGIEHEYAFLFRILNLVLALPVFFYSASEFFSSAWAGLKQKILNIDAPIVLALIITFARSVYEIATHTGSGYLDSMSGIVFFMLVGRVVQERAYKSISFHRDYKSYFPIAVNVVTKDGIVSKNLQDLQEKDVVELHNDEIIPADAILINGNARIDYSFVTGESEPVLIEAGKLVYAGGKQVGEKITIQVVKPVAGSYLTSLWNHHSFAKNKAEKNNRDSMIHVMSKYFTIVLFALAAATAIYWWANDPSKILPSVSAMLIVACPCALLLAATYTNGNLLRLLSNNGLYLRDATVIEQIGDATHIVFDKTGTLTQGSKQFHVTGHQLTEAEKAWVYNTAIHSQHPYSKALIKYLGAFPVTNLDKWEEHTGKGLYAEIEGSTIQIGSAAFAGVTLEQSGIQPALYIRINEKVTAFYIITEFRGEVTKLIPALNERYSLSLLSGDNDRQRAELQSLFGQNSQLLFEQKPLDKLHYIKKLQDGGQSVLMVGDGLNDAGALQQSNVGITLADDINNFTPSCDAILDAGKFAKFPALLKLAYSGKYIIYFSFIISILYNIVGLSISMQGKMNPMIAAILMPVSTLSIVLITTGLGSFVAKKSGLSLKA